VADTDLCSILCPVLEFETGNSRTRAECATTLPTHPVCRYRYLCFDLSIVCYVAITSHSLYCFILYPLHALAVRYIKELYLLTCQTVSNQYILTEGSAAWKLLKTQAQTIS